jgi:hypothetical protein
MSLRTTQYIALFLILTAGLLWSQKLSREHLNQNVAALQAAEIDQIDKVEQRIADINDPIALVDMGRKFLAAGNPRFAVVPLLKATELKPGYRDGWYLLGYSYLEISNMYGSDTRKSADKQVALNQAADALLQARKIDPAHQPTADLLAQLGIESGGGVGVGGSEQ